MAALQGRWILEAENDETNFVVVDSCGTVSVAGDDQAPEAKLTEAEAPADNPWQCFKLVSVETGEQLCAVELHESDDGSQELLLLGADGYREKWRRTSGSDGSPKIVSRKAACFPRRWTRENPSSSAGQPGFSSKGREASIKEEDSMAGS
eukprot:TRINITY_DN61222_c0_g1_i1.p1 TRINITY_DN61222_c0_g1~~TRINITY_DN61222_c0_g1_i1.p1  ORF type:complete len:162 (+),score=31.09 TRINITY_DN61222_c0_g1_i1:38-487(+)